MNTSLLTCSKIVPAKGKLTKVGTGPPGEGINTMWTSVAFILSPDFAAAEPNGLPYILLKKRII
jgi:hypothetical protein